MTTDNTNATTQPVASTEAPAVTTTGTSAATPAAAPAPVTLHVNDIVNGTILLRVAIERGVFKAEEVGEVGAVYNKLNSFVQYLQAVAQAESVAGSKATEAKNDVVTPAPTETKKKRGSKKSA